MKFLSLCKSVFTMRALWSTWSEIDPANLWNMIINYSIIYFMHQPIWLPALNTCFHCFLPVNWSTNFITIFRFRHIFIYILIFLSTYGICLGKKCPLWTLLGLGQDSRVIFLIATQGKTNFEIVHYFLQYTCFGWNIFFRHTP